MKVRGDIPRSEIFSKEIDMFQSRWGFHPCDYSTFRMLKFLNQVYLKAVRMAHAWERWHRKDPQNRVMRWRIRNECGQTIGYEAAIPLPEPRICPLFSQKMFVKRHVDKKGNFSREGIMEEKVVTDGLWIPADYAAARKPVADPVGIQPLHHSVAELEALCEKARFWLENQDVS